MFEMNDLVRHTGYDPNVYVVRLRLIRIQGETEYIIQTGDHQSVVPESRLVRINKYRQGDLVVETKRSRTVGPYRKTTGKVLDISYNGIYDGVIYTVNFRNMVRFIEEGCLMPKRIKKAD